MIFFIFTENQNPLKSLCLSALLVALCSLIQAQVTTYPDRTYGDTLHAPFYHGVASGDPLSDRVIIWSRITPASTSETPTVNWVMATDSLFSNITASGTFQTDSNRDFTIKTDVSGLAPDMVYYYRFDDGSGHYSQTGRTRTAPVGNVSNLRFAVFSCSSIYSGYFNAYARIAEKSATLNAAIHLGDYIYDFVDPDEEIRVPQPYPTEPNNLKTWRGRHEYYLLDPDLRNARASLPWIVIWDNHDMDCNTSTGFCDSTAIRAFLEWIPMRLPNPSDSAVIYRTFSYGNLADIVMTDVLVHRHDDLMPGGEYNILGNTQYLWLKNQLNTSTAKWKIMGNERMTGGWYTHGIAQWVLDIVPNDGNVFDNGSWDGFMETRDSLFDFIAANSIHNFVVLSGDAHVSIAQDLTKDPFDTTQYDPVTGNGSVGIEFLPTSISRGNLDESGAPIGLASTFNTVDLQANPQHRFADLFQHGYGIIDLKQDSLTAEIWYDDKLSITSSESMGAMLVAIDGENRWKREPILGIKPVEYHTIRIFPNPGEGVINITGLGDQSSNITARITDVYGHTVRSVSLSVSETIQLQVYDLAAGLYFLDIPGITKPVAFIKSK